MRISKKMQLSNEKLSNKQNYGEYLSHGMQITS